ncbi:MAG: DUF4129 domain-containing protein [Micromonosporaceae bacterium]|jgi:hypothetical protein
MRAGRPRWVPVVVAVLAVGVAGLAAAGPGFVGRPVPPARLDDPLPGGERQSGGLPSIPPDLDASEEQVPGSDLFEALFLAFVAAAVLTTAVLVAYQIYRTIHNLLTARVRRRELERRASQPDEEFEAEQVRGAVRAGLADLDAGGDPRRAVIACWLRLERIAAAAGTAREIADTPGDLVGRLLARHRVSRAALERLADAYRLARFAPAQVGPELVGIAREALRDLDAQLRLPVDAGGGR